MMGDALPADHRVLRYVRPRYLESDGGDGPRIDGAAFLRRPAETGLSVNWLECFDGTVPEQVASVRKARRLAYAATAKLARLNIGRVVQAIDGAGLGDTPARIAHDPLDAAPPDHPLADPSHASITGVPVVDTPEGETIGDLIRRCVDQVFPARVDG